MMTGLLRPDGGQVLVNGLDVWADPPAAKAIMGVVPAEVRLFERLSGEELLEYSGRLRGLPAADARSPRHAQRWQPGALPASCQRRQHTQQAGDPVIMSSKGFTTLPTARAELILSP